MRFAQQFRTKLTTSMCLDFALCYVVEKGCKSVFASLEPDEMVTRGRERREKRRAEEEAQKMLTAAEEEKVKLLGEGEKKNQ